MLRERTSLELTGRYSSFHSVEQTLGQVIDLMLKNDRLLRLLYYPDKQALSLPQLRTEQIREVLRHQIKTVPKLDIQTSDRPFIVISLDNFTPDGTTTYYRNFQLQFDIVCPYDVWQLNDFKLRPYSIAGEIDALINKSNINKNGIADFAGARSILLNNDLGGISLYYDVSAVGTDAKLHKEEKKPEDLFS